MKYLKIFTFFFVFVIFIYLRITPIIDQTVPYTYDQGRDFLKVEEIIKNKNLTFIGPTTGIQGVHHGAWWYYFLILPYILFNGWPQGFYLALLFISVVSILSFFYFLYKEFGLKSSFLFLLIVSFSNFFIKLSFFASNNTVSPLLIPFLIVFVYSFFKNESTKYLFLISITLGFILEFEVAFGIFVIISFFVTSLFFKKFRIIYFDFKKSVIFYSGFIIPFLPRLLFEVKNNFIQTKAFINFFNNPSSTNVSSFTSTLAERVNLFIKYYLQLIPFENSLLGVLIFIFLLLLLNQLRNIKNFKKEVSLFFSLFILVIFGVSLLSRNNFFWDYYLDGVQFILLFIIILFFSYKSRFEYLKKIVLLTFFLSLVLTFQKSLFNKEKPLIGLKADNKIVNYFVNKYPNDYFCLRIYTPPVIPYTYNYLFSYYANLQKIRYPKGDFYKNQCYFIFDKEPYQFRVDEWRKINIPIEANKVETIKFENGTNIELWSINSSR